MDQEVSLLLPALQDEMRSPAAIFLQLIQFLKSQGVRYCVVGDTQTMPEVIESDVDIVVEQSALAQLKTLVPAFCKTAGVDVIQCIRHEQTAYFFVLTWLDERGKRQYLHPDFCGDYFRYGRYFLSATDVLAGAQEAVNPEGRNKGFYIPVPAKAFIYYLIKKTGKQHLAEAHTEYLSDLFRQEPEGSRSELLKFWPSEDARLLGEAAQANRWETVIASLPCLNHALQRRSNASFKRIVLEFLRKLGRFLYPTGVWIALIGPDGCGKSTVIESVLKEMTPAFRRCQPLFLRPGHKLAKSQAVTNPHGQPPRNILMSLVKLMYFLWDYSCGYLFKIRPMLVRSTFVVFDRYFFDLLADPKRFRYGAPLWAAKILMPLIPKPELTILLDAPPDVLQARKQETTMEETVRLRQAYLLLAKSLPNTVVINSNQPIEQVVQEVTQALVREMTKRVERRAAGS